MSMRQGAFFASTGVSPPIVISFGKASLNLTGQRFSVNAVSIPFNVATLQLNGKTFVVQRGTINYDNGFMAF